MNFIAFIVLIGAGQHKMNNLGTSIPAIVCLIAGIRGVIDVRRNRNKEEEE